MWRWVSRASWPCAIDRHSPPAIGLGALPLLLVRHFSTPPLKILRNIGISAHIDSGKTTLTERILYYTGRINQIHEVRGKDQVGAKMDFMELEREKGITIQAAATHCYWKGHHINIIDTPGHVDFTIEVERALRVLDSAILVICAVSGVQSQSLTVDRQMRRYKVPRLIFINKLDRMGADPWRALKAVRDTLKLNAAALQIPIGAEEQLKGVVDLISRQAYYSAGNSGENLEVGDVPEDLKAEMETKRRELIEKLADADEEIAEKFLVDEEPTPEQIKTAIRRSTIALKFIPVFMGAAFKNKGVQMLLDGVVDYLPDPTQVQNYALDQDQEESKVELLPDDKKPFVGLAFKLEEGKFGQLTYMRVYQGKLRKGDNIVNTSDRRKVRVPRLVRMHANEMEDIADISGGDICAMFGVDCASGTTFTGGGLRYTMTSMHVPEPVISLAIKPKSPTEGQKFAKALNRFIREDPTFRISYEEETGQTLISGMGELHLQIYAERIQREYGVLVDVGHPKVNYREAPTERGEFNYTHKKQSGGQGQYGRLQGYIEPLPLNSGERFQFVNKLQGNDVPPNFLPAIQKGFADAIDRGILAGYPVQSVRIVITEGSSHPVDSTELAFRNCATGCFRTGMANTSPVILEPMMTVQVEIPGEFQGAVVGGLVQRKGQVTNVEIRDGNFCIIDAEVPLEGMFGYSTDLRSQTEGKGTFTMEYKVHAPVNGSVQDQLIRKYLQALADSHKKHQKASDDY